MIITYLIIKYSKIFLIFSRSMTLSATCFAYSIKEWYMVDSRITKICVFTF